ncbi:creatininase family protein, partial [Thermodesulfobacteriota bacterium]
MTVRLDEMSWLDAKEVLTKPHAVILPIGSTEEHGAHLPLNVDSACVTYTAEGAARKTADEHGVTALVAPTIHYTDIGPHKRFPGTIGIKIETLIQTLVEIIEAFLDQGFKNVIGLSGHLENNSPLEIACRIVADRRPEANIYGLTVVHGLGSHALPSLLKGGIPGIGHALEVESCIAMVIQPQNVHLDKTIVGHRRLPLSEKYIGLVGKDKT